MEPLPRSQFRDAVFKRDGFKCVVCEEDAKDAHHILERRLFPDGGYYPRNGASVCGPCHIKCEQTIISPERLRELCGIEDRILPPHLYSDYKYDKWGNIMLPNGTRVKGELYYDEGVQKILPDEIKSRFIEHVKYPRTHHLPWSPGMTDDDRMMPGLRWLSGENVIVTEKMDGENTNMYRDYLHARSIDSSSHPSQSWVRNFHSKISYEIPEGWRICGENLYATHSIKYSNLDSYFMGFSIWNEKNQCLSWNETLSWFKLLGIEPVPVLWEGPFDDLPEKFIRASNQDFDFNKMEGYVIRDEKSFHYKDFSRKVGKFVRENHVETRQHHWRYNWDSRDVNELK